MAENDPSQSDYSILKSTIYLSKEMMFKFDFWHVVIDSRNKK